MIFMPYGQQPKLQPTLPVASVNEISGFPAYGKQELDQISTETIIKGRGCKDNIDLSRPL